MINNNLFLTLIVFFLLVCLSTVLVSISGIVWLSFVPLVVAFVFTLIVISRIDKSIQELTDIRLRASRGDFSGRYSRKNDWEIEPLGFAINDLIENFIQVIDHYKIDREELKALLNNISEAMWIQDKAGKLTWTSQGFMDVFPSYKRGSDQHYWEVVHDANLLDYIKEVLSGVDIQAREIELDSSFYLVRGIFNRRNDTHIFFLQNITLFKQTEKMKKDFMINLAHELRTPLTAIKGFSEALEDKVKPDNARFLNIIRNHTERMINLVSDFQTLASLERLPELNLQSINLLTFLENIKTLYLNTLDERNLYLDINARGEIPRLDVDPFKFEQIFINLIDNALRFTEQGGIRINLETAGKTVRIEVCDTGRGIEPEHLPRIFERFYVTDSSRNKNISGTGLGLAIVKHCVMLHKGTIEVTSEPGKGTCFLMNFRLPHVSK
jgi:two-component system phosphate regulon sensor histidine kinase PhoR